MTLAPVARDTSREEKPRRGRRTGRRFLEGRTGAGLILAGFVMAALLVLPGRTVLTLRPEDLSVLLDGGARVLHGQVPHRDFHMMLGPLTAVLPALGLALSGNPGAAFPLASAILVLAATPVVARVTTSRLPPLLAIPAGLFALVLTAVPINPGEGVTALSATGWHNRIGWAGLFVLFLMILPPLRQDRRSSALDAVCAGAIAMTLILTKASFGAAAVVFLLLLAADRRLRPAALGALVFAALVLAAAELAFGFFEAYAEDALRALNADAWIRGSRGDIVEHALGNLADFVLFLLAAGLCMLRAGTLRTAVFFLLCAAGGFLLINQAFQPWGIMTLHAGATVAAERIRRSAAPDETSAVVSGTPFVALAMLLPPAFHFGTALMLHAAAAVTLRPSSFADLGIRDVVIADLWTRGDHRTALAYAERTEDGLRALRRLRPDGRIVALDYANPFPLALGLPPASGDVVGFRAGRTFDARNPVPPESVFADAAIVMVPKPGPARPFEGGRGTAAEALRSIYGPFLEDRFVRSAESEHWLIYARTMQPSVGPTTPPPRE